MEYVLSFFKRKRSTNNKFCYIIGSFANTAPNLRTPQSDIDIICSTNIDEFEIRYFLKKEYPNIPPDIKLDIHYSTPVNNTVEYNICYWQNSAYLPLISNNSIHMVPVRGNIDLPSVLRNEKNNDLPEYFNKVKKIEISHPIHFANSIKNHYGIDKFINTLNSSSLGYQEKNLLKNLLQINKISSSVHDDNYTHISIDKETNQIISKNKTIDYYNFYRNYMGYGRIYSFLYSNVWIKNMEKIFRD